MLLCNLDAQLLLRHQCLFGGGTAIALSHGEHRESLDVDFVCSSLPGYRGLRELVSQHGMSWAFARPMQLLRDPKVDQYGIRCAVSVDGAPIKFEIVFEGRVQLADPGPQDRICGVWTMTLDDLAATKLMANADWWADDSAMSRDLIDLAMLADGGVLPAAAVAKARNAYGGSIDSSFERAKRHLLGRPGRLWHCMTRMGMTMTEELLRDRVERLALESGDARRRV